MFVRQLCFVVVLAMVGLADDPQGFVGGESSATLDLASFVYGNATFQLIGKKLGIKIGDAASKIEKPTKVTFVFGTCSVSGRVFWHHRGKAAFEFENSDAVALQADASYDGKQLSVTGTNAQNNQPVTIAGDCSAGEIKDNGTLVVAVTAESNVPVTLTVEAPFAKEAASAGMAWYYIVGICVGCIVFVAALIGGGIFAWKKWGKRWQGKGRSNCKES
ncbi:hypothetical protein M3Y94_00422000 [Aphelenchoides besseyi]|nr:hypothetical protein M3Y94_00422000 [Aphelenchoides besseyi]